MASPPERPDMEGGEIEHQEHVLEIWYTVGKTHDYYIEKDIYPDITFSFIFPPLDSIIHRTQP